MGKNSPSAQPTNKTWRGMMSRCNNTNDKDYHRVGGKGIRVCAAWGTFEGFLADMGEKPEGTFLRRLDESAHFEPGNCVWDKHVNAATNPVYTVWKSIRRRCGIIGHAESRATTHYVTRGVKLHPDWHDDFHAFAEHVGPRPSMEHTLDRLDNNLGYVPGNLAWRLQQEQANNRMDNVVIEMRGERRTLSQWAVLHGVSIPLVMTRFNSLFDVPQRRKQSVQQLRADGYLLGVFENVRQASAASGVSVAALQKCLCGHNQTAGGYKWAYVSD